MKYLGYEWSYEQIPILKNRIEPVNHYSNPQIGEFYLSKRASIKLGGDPTNLIHILLSAIYETKYTNKELFICLEEEKKEMHNSSVLPITTEEIVNKYPQNITEKQEKILLLLYKKNPNIGEAIIFNHYEPYMFYAKNEPEMGYLLELMNKKELIECTIHWEGDDPTILDDIKIEEEGWNFIEKLLQKEKSKNVFIAMWFDPIMDTAAIEIEKEVTELCFEVIRIDRKEHNNEISGEILYEIRQCKFLIADVTGQRHGVYFEAGYAMGQGIPVIWCCKKSEITEVHFDTRQYNHVVWETEKEILQKLSDRIKGTIL